MNIRESLRLARQFQLRALELTDTNAIARLLDAAVAEIDDAMERNRVAGIRRIDVKRVDDDVLVSWTE